MTFSIKCDRVVSFCRLAAAYIFQSHQLMKREVLDPPGQGARRQQVASLLSSVQETYYQGSYFQLPWGLIALTFSTCVKPEAIAPVDQKMDQCIGEEGTWWYVKGKLEARWNALKVYLSQDFKLQTFANIYRKIPMPDVATVDISHLYLPICGVVYFPVRLFFGSDFWDASFEHLTVATVSFKLKSTVHAFGKIAVTKGLGMPGMPPVWQGAGGFVGVFFFGLKRRAREYCIGVV